MQNLTVIILAAGGGTRMKSKTVKVLHQLGGRSMVGHVLHAVRATEPRRVVAVVGNQADEVSAHIKALDPNCHLAVQPVSTPGGPPVPYGTAYAVSVGVESLLATDGPDSLGGTGDTVLVVTGDTPLLTAETLRAFAAEHRAAERAVSILSGRVPDPRGYGRIVRNGEGDVEAIVEENDATPAQRDIDEINSGILAFDAAFLTEALPKISDTNAKGEFYLTDAVALAREAGLTVGAHLIDDVMQTEGVNDRSQLAALGKELNRRILDRWMRDGVTIIDPATTWIDADAVLHTDVVLLPGVQLLGATVVDEDAVVGPDCTLKDCEIGRGARVVRTHGELAVVGAAASVGPFTYLRPGTVLGERGKIGAFCETKNASIGAGSKVPHLSYVGDAEIGEDSNIGAGTIVANYDGVAKHRTTIGSHVRTGSGNVFVAPVTVGDGAATGAGTTVRRDVAPGALAVSAGDQRNIDGWTERRRAGTAGSGSGSPAGTRRSGTRCARG